MIDFFSRLFASDFLPHGYCMRWRPELVWLHIISDGLIAIAYFCIPFTLAHLVRRRKDFPFPWMLWLFGLFIVACGTTHLLGIWTLFKPVYRLDGVVKAVTALASLPTAGLLIWLMPRALALPSPEALRKEVDERRKAEDEVRRLNAELEERVQERTARLARSNEALQRIAYIASHDLQEPIRMVSCYNKLLADRYHGRLGKDADTFIQYAVDGSRRMETLVADLLALVTSLGEPCDRRRNLDPKELIDSAVKDLRLAIEESDAEIEVGELADVEGEPVQLKQVFQNLISNAIKYAKHGEKPRISIQGRNRDDSVEFRVRDEGIGIDPRYAEYIFQPFKRLHGAEYPGSGIGLAICKNVVEDHKGRIWFESTLGAGTTFFFTLPAAQLSSDCDKQETPVDQRY